MPAKKRSIVQEHHISYNPEVKVTVFKGEHYVLTLLGWRRRFSKGFCVALRDFLDKNEKYAVELGT